MTFDIYVNKVRMYLEQRSKTDRGQLTRDVIQFLGVSSITK